MRPHVRHLLAALHDAEGRDHQLLHSLSESDWTAVVELAARNRVGSLLYSRPGLPVPAAARAALKARAMQSARRILVLRAAFLELSEAAASRGLDLVLLKGLHLATSVYPSVGLREMVDLDILVPNDQLQAVADLARDMGYTAPAGRGTAHHHLPPMVRNRVSLEFHWQLFDEAHGAIHAPAGLFERAVPLRAFPHARGLCNEDLLLHVCLHAASHHVLEMGVRSLCDVQAIVATAGTQMNWTTVINRAREWRGERSVALMFTLARLHLGVTFPPHVLPELDDAIPGPDIISAATDFLVEDSKHLAGTSEAARTLLTLGSTRERVRHAVHQILRPHQTQPEALKPRGMDRLGLLVSLPARAYGLARRHSGWLWRASQPGASPIHSAVVRRNELADWIRNR